MSRLSTLLLVALVLAPVALGDVYMHNPSGSNGRNRERSENRANANRLFDTQNNAKGGYPWRGDRELKGKPDPMVYYEGSKLPITWTSQHGCGPNENTHCQIVIQYACDDTLPGLRDGYPTGDLGPSDTLRPEEYQQATFTLNNADGTDEIPTDPDDEKSKSVEFGMHENHEWYNKWCAGRTRNMGLYTADRKLNRADARATRQNPNGARRGLECPEERDYYPYWHPTPFRDVAVLVSDTKWCPYYRTESQNVKDRYFCDISETDVQNLQNRPKLIPIEEGPCTAGGGTWKKAEAFGIEPPVCDFSPFSRDNHLGNAYPVNADGTPIGGVHPDVATFDWTVPEVPGDKDDRLCVLRMRYNISTEDYPSMNGFTTEESSQEEQDAKLFDFRKNCPRVQDNGDASDPDHEDSEVSNAGCSDKLSNGNRPLYNRPYVQVFNGDGEEAKGAPKLSLAINTNQLGRTFQDRSYVFKIAKRPDDVPAGATIHNLNVQGRRGNIVQCYPAVEYDFVPRTLNARRGDWIHFQWSGSDFNPPRNPNNAEGWRYSDRSNLVMTTEANTQVPVGDDGITLFDIEKARLFAMAGSEEGVKKHGTTCKAFKNGEDNDEEQNSIQNCGKLNAAPAHFNPKPVFTGQQRGTYDFISTRNNNFSNRSQKGRIVVTGLSTAETALVSVGSIVGAGGIGFLALLLFRRRRRAKGGDGSASSGYVTRDVPSTSSAPLPTSVEMRAATPAPSAAAASYAGSAYGSRPAAGSSPPPLAAY
eukprot:PLAT2650.1.p1 GENE.PLAT2650.1~~PLAT2650.1.p1  ORF type:complete len:767 (-),score=337.27 PLAT2650.1:317-2593(-)